MNITTGIILAVVIVYMAFMVFIGIMTSRKNKSTDDFYLGGRRLGPLVTAMSAEASDMSGWLLMGLPGVALAGALISGDVSSTGFAEAVWTAVGLAIGTYLNWLFVAKRLRKYSAAVNASTVPDFFSNRFRDSSGVLTVLCALIIIVFFVPYTASGFASVGKLFNSLFGLDYHLAMIIGAVVICAYTVIGGFLAASVTDLVQSIVMTIALVVVVGFIVSNAGGWSNAIGTAESVTNYFSLTGSDGSYNALTIASTLAWGLGYFGMPHILLRFMAIRDEKKLKTSRRIASVWVTISMGIAILIGIIGASFAVKNNLVTNDFDPERIIISVSSIFGEINPGFAVIAGLIVAGILASVMSTSDSQMLAASSSMSENIVHRIFAKNMRPETQMWVARGTVIAVAVVGVIFAWNPDSSVFRIVSFAWAGFGASFGPLMLCSLFWKRTNRAGAIAGILAGSITIFVWKFGIAKLGGIFAIYELLPAFLISLLAIITVSLVTAKPCKEITDEFNSVKNA